MGNIEGESRSSVYITVYMVFNYQRTHIIFFYSFPWFKLFSPLSYFIPLWDGLSLKV